MGTAVEVRWDEGGEAAELIARVPLEAGTQLSEGHTLLGQSGAAVLTSHGFAGLHCLQTAQAGAPNHFPAPAQCIMCTLQGLWNLPSLISISLSGMMQNGSKCLGQGGKNMLLHFWQASPQLRGVSILA